MRKSYLITPIVVHALACGSTALAKTSADKDSVYSWGAWDKLVSPAAGPVGAGGPVDMAAFVAPEHDPDINLDDPTEPQQDDPPGEPIPPETVAEIINPLGVLSGYGKRIEGSGSSSNQFNDINNSNEIADIPNEPVAITQGAAEASRVTFGFDIEADRDLATLAPTNFSPDYDSAEGPEGETLLESLQWGQEGPTYTKNDEDSAVPNSLGTLTHLGLRDETVTRTDSFPYQEPPSAEEGSGPENALNSFNSQLSTLGLTENETMNYQYGYDEEGNFSFSDTETFTEETGEPQVNVAVDLSPVLGPGSGIYVITLSKRC